jgi:hypothetical protein
MPSIENARIAKYTVFLQEPSRSPSRGGNGRAWHSHRITIGEDHYSWLGLGFRKWIHKSDTVSFAWEFDLTGKYRNAIPESIRVIDRHGKRQTRGERGSKPWRTATQRLPGSRREQRD